MYRYVYTPTARSPFTAADSFERKHCSDHAKQGPSRACNLQAASIPGDREDRRVRSNVGGRWRAIAHGARTDPGTERPVDRCSVVGSYQGCQVEFHSQSARTVSRALRLIVSIPNTQTGRRHPSVCERQRAVSAGCREMHRGDRCRRCNVSGRQSLQPVHIRGSPST